MGRNKHRWFQGEMMAIKYRVGGDEHRYVLCGDGQDGGRFGIGWAADLLTEQSAEIEKLQLGKFRQSQS